nr:MAG TPA: hypothetical protein [Caudoviricetes sp.]
MLLEASIRVHKVTLPEKPLEALRNDFRAS